MKKRVSKLIAFLLVFTLMLPVFGTIAETITAQAAAPSLNVTSKKVYLGTTYQLELKNVDKADTNSIKWRINRKAICTIDQTGLLTPVKYGTTTAFCDIEFKNGTKQTLKCTVYVRNRIQPTSVTITNKTESGLNYRTLYIGKTLTIQKTVQPSKVTDTAYYVSHNEDVATVSSKGKITAVSEGIAMIEVRYGVSKTDAMRADNKAVDRIFIHVTEKPKPIPTVTPTPTATPTPTPVIEPEVADVKMVGSQELQITFSEPVNKASVISDGKLVNGTVFIGKDGTAADCGSIVPALSKDKRILTLALGGALNGNYSIVVTDKVRTEDGDTFRQYVKIANWKDTIGPAYIGTSVGYTGWECSINFNESIDIKDMTIEGVSGTTDALLVSYLQDISNYKLSADKKSITLDLSGAITDKTKSVVVNVKLKGIRDNAGNSTAGLIQSVTVRTDISTKPLAQILSAERISRTQIAVTFSGAISYPGMVTFNNNTYGVATSYGVVDVEDPTIVYYEIPASYQKLTTTQIVSFSNWYSYNASSLQNGSYTMLLDLSLDTTAPMLESYTMTNAVQDGISVAKLTLTYNKDIAIASTLQPMSIRVRSTNGNISTLDAISVSAKVEGNTVTYVFADTALLESGVFQITLPEGMVADKFENYSFAREIQVNKNTTSSTELPAPSGVLQDTANLSIVYVTFANKLDPVSAEEIVHYYIAGNNNSRIYPINASVVTQNDNGATVALTFANGTFTGTVSSYELVINGVSGFNGSYTAISDAHVLLSAVENECPHTSSTIRLSDANTIQLTMSEPVSGTIKITATDTITGRKINGTGYGTGTNTVYITLDSAPTATTSILRFVVTSNEIIDMNGNKADFSLTTTYVAVKN